MTTEEHTAATFDQWCILELMGHVRLAGRVTEEVMFGAALGRIDIPSGDGFTTQYFGGSSIYRITPTTEEVARLIAIHNQPAPVHRWELPAPRVPAAVADAATGWGQDGPSALDDAMIEDRATDEDDGYNDLCEDDDEDDLSGGDEAEAETARESWR